MMPTNRDQRHALISLSHHVQPEKSLKQPKREVEKSVGLTAVAIF